MQNTLGRLQPAQFYQASGEATPQAQLPEQFVSNPPPSSPLTSANAPPHAYWHDIRTRSYVQRMERTVGMRTVYARGMTRMPIRRDGADGTPRPWNSAANRNDMGTIRNCHFNDALFQAGYPGYNLALSFKVIGLNTLPGRSRSADLTPANINVSNNTTLVQRAVQGIKRMWGRSASG
jgi:hypothetical protein